MSDIHIDSEQEKNIKTKLLIFDEKLNDIVEALNKLHVEQKQEEKAQDEQAYQTKQNLLKLVEYMKETNETEKSEREEDYKTLTSNTKKIAQDLKKLIENYAKEMMSFKVMKNRLDNSQDTQIAVVKAEIAKERAKTSQKRAELESKIEVNKADMAKEKVVLMNNINKESLEREKENAGLENQLKKINLRQNQLQNANNLVEKQMEDRTKQIEERMQELEKIVAILKQKNNDIE